MNIRQTLPPLGSTNIGAILHYACMNRPTAAITDHPEHGPAIGCTAYGCGTWLPLAPLPEVALTFMEEHAGTHPPEHFPILTNNGPHFSGLN